jgi:hypothetical protein
MRVGDKVKIKPGTTFAGEIGTLSNITGAYEEKLIWAVTLDYFLNNVEVLLFEEEFELCEPPTSGPCECGAEKCSNAFHALWCPKWRAIC